MTRKELAKSAYVSERFLAQLETGHGNISIIRLRRIAHAMDLGVERLAQERNGEVPEIAGTIALLEKLKPEERRRAQALLLEKFGARSEEERRGRIALVGLRGAGKSTLGALLAERIHFTKNFISVLFVRSGLQRLTNAAEKKIIIIMITGNWKSLLRISSSIISKNK